MSLLIGQVKGFYIKNDALYLCPEQDAFEPRTVALWRASQILSEHHGVPLHGEVYPVVQKWGDEPMARIDRAAIPWFGTVGHGVHVNGFVRKNDGIHIWVAERAHDRRIDPGKLDNMIGGGLPLGLTIQENLAKEAWEEAGLPAATAARSVAAGVLHYALEKMKGLRNDVLFVFDLALPENVLPSNTDGEVKQFTLMPAEEVVQIVRNTDRFKFNCNLVMIDFFLRHHLIAVEDPEYGALKAAVDKMRA